MLVAVEIFPTMCRKQNVVYRWKGEKKRKEIS